MYMEQKENTYLTQYRHSLSHLLGAALMDLYPNTLLTIGPAIENGFYYDAQIPHTITPADLPKIEKKMHKILSTWDKPITKKVSKEEALEYYKNNKFKKELIEEISKEGEDITLVTFGNFTDLCRGGHIESMKNIDKESFVLSTFSSIYWRGDEKKDTLTRIYGYAFETKEKLEKYIEMREESKKRDHRLIGEQMDIFTSSKLIGPGLPLWLPNGRTLQMLLEKWSEQVEKINGYQQVATPLLTKDKLFYKSEHLPHYKEDMYNPMEIDGDKYYIKPMNCPMHNELFKSRPHSYRELPIRFSEYGFCHRYEDSGALLGIMRSRSMKMNDAHIYCSKSQVVEEFVNVIKLHQYYYKHLDIKECSIVLALRDKKSDKYHGKDEMWDEAEQLTKEAMEKADIPYIVKNEGAAFYGPKIDFQIKSSIGKQYTVSTSQLDLFMAGKFDLEFINEKGQKETPVIIHRSPLGTHERFIGFLLEHFAGRFPFWLAPEQIRILSVSSKIEDYIKEVEDIVKNIVLSEPIKYNEIRYTIDNSNHSIGKKIKEAALKKIPLIIVVGEKDMQSRVVSIRNYERQETVSLNELKEYIEKL